MTGSPDRTAQAAATAAEVVTDLAARLADPVEVGARRTADAAGDWWPAPTLVEGHPAIALLFAELGHVDERHRVVAHRWLSGAVSAYGRAPRGAFAGGATGGLYAGAGAIAFAARAAARRPGDYATLLVALDDQVTRGARDIVRAERERIAAGRAGTTFAAYDVISGVTGLGRYLLAAGERARPAVADVLAYLVELTRPVTVAGRTVPGWWAAHGTSPYTVRPAPGGASSAAAGGAGHLNLGLAHGIPGPLALLALAWRAGVRVPGQDEAMERIVTWLLDWTGDEGAGPYWPESITLGEHTRRPRRLQPSRDAWCYGAPGVARAVQLAGQALGRSGWTAAALDAVHAFLRRADAPLGVEDAGLCHGLSGLLRLLDRIGADSGDRTVLAAADELAARVVASYDPPAPFGFRAVLPTSKRADLTGFLTGASGIALALHAHDRGGPPATGWDAALLIA